MNPLQKSYRCKKAELRFWQLQGIVYFPLFFWAGPFADRLIFRNIHQEFPSGEIRFGIAAVTLALALLGSFYCKRYESNFHQSDFSKFANFLFGIVINRAYVVIVAGYLLLFAGLSLGPLRG